MKSLLTPENERNLRALVTEKISPALAASVLEYVRNTSSDSLPSVEGASLALLACAELEPDETTRLALRDAAQEGLVHALQTDPTHVGLSDGASGLLATLRVASNSFDVELDDAVRSAFFEATLRHLDVHEAECGSAEGTVSTLTATPLERTYDLLYGYGGILLSTHGERVSEALLVRARCEALLRRHVRWSEEVAYFESGERKDAGAHEASINLGFAHGLVGLLTPLAQVQELRDIAQGIGRLLLELDRIRALREPTAPHVYPSLLPISALQDLEAWWSVPRIRSRFAWCYGDAGVALALVRTAPLLPKLNFDGAISRMVASCASRHKGHVDAGVVDAAFCHGSAGNMHCLAEVYRTTGDERLKDAINFWAEDTLARYAKGQACFFGNREGTDFDERYSILTGIPSLVCPIASTIGAIDGSWDHALGLC